MTPNDFTSNLAYQHYVMSCEQSIKYEVDGELYSFNAATKIEEPDHDETCGEEENYCWCLGNEDGFIWTWAPGGNHTSHVTHPMFTLKDDLGPHRYDEADGRNCAYCYPEEFYYSPLTHKKVSRAEADKLFWNAIIVGWAHERREWEEYIGPLPPYEPHKNGPCP